MTKGGDFSPDEQFFLQDDVKDSLQGTTPNELSRLSSRIGGAVQVTGEALKLSEVLRAHSATIIAKGNASKHRYQMRVSENLTLNELLTYKIPRVFDH